MTSDGKKSWDLITDKFEAFKTIESDMDRAISIEELEILMKSLSECFNELIILLRTLKKEQPEIFFELSIDIITSISKKGSIYIRNRERLDPTYDFDQGGIDENED